MKGRRATRQIYERAENNMVIEHAVMLEFWPQLPNLYYNYTVWSTTNYTGWSVVQNHWLIM